MRRFAIVAAYQGSYNKKKEKLYTVYRPNTGLQPRQETLEEIKKKYKKVKIQFFKSCTIVCMNKLQQM